MTRRSLAVLFGSSLVACSLVTSLDDLRAPGDAAPASDAADVSPMPESGVDAHPTPDASDAPNDAPVGTISFVAASSASSVTASSSIDISKPTGTVTGDFVFAMLAIDDGSATPTVPSAWNLATRATDAMYGFETFAWYFFASASEPASYTITLPSAIDWSVTLVAYAGVQPTSPFDVMPSMTKVASPPYTAAAITTTVPNALVIFGFVGETGDGSWSASSPLVSRAQEDYLLAADMLLASPGSSGAQSASYSDGASPGMVLVGALAPQ